MKRTLLIPAFLAFVTPAFGAAPLTGFPFMDESLAYTINWPSGLSVGEAHLNAKHTAGGWTFEFKLDAGVPGYTVKDSYSSESNADFCSMEFDRDYAHGSRKGGEKESIDRSHETASRVTTHNGGKSEMRIPDCVKDALTAVFYTRRELGQGRVPGAQQILFGGLYQMTLDYGGAQMVKIADKPAQTDKIVCNLKGPSASIAFEMYFARDAARTPLLVKVPLSMGNFSMEIVR
ncbi:MAG: DUF3108 domain-containing protein [Terriglobia bacterium]